MTIKAFVSLHLTWWSGKNRAQEWSGKTVRKTLENSVRMFLTWVGWEHTYDGED